MYIQIKKLNPKAIIPGYATIMSAGIDLSACIPKNIDIGPQCTAMISTGLAINMSSVPGSIMAMIMPRSGKGSKEGKVLGNTVGIIDQDYQGELMICMFNRNPDKYVTIEDGERIAQLIFAPISKLSFNEVKEFTAQTARGTGGFGSTG